MKRYFRSLQLAIASALVGSSLAALAPRAFAASDAPAAADSKEVELFSAMRDGTVEAKIIVKNDHEARVFITNNTKQPLSIKLPEAFAAVPALAQRAGGGGGSGRSTGGSGGGGGQQQSTGGGLGGGGGGGGGQFSVPPEKTERIDAEVVCLDHGLVEPSSSKPYKLMPADEHLDRPEVIELLKALGRGELQHGAAQAAAWHLNNDLTWDELAAKRQGTKRNLNRPPYFTSEEMKLAVAYAGAATSRAQNVSPEERAAKKAAEDLKSSETRSTTNE
jgi:hypothetical protein